MKLSIITINYNNAADLLKTINSVLEQSWMDYEFLIIDGGSTDGSLEHIKKVQDRLGYWVSEKDRGVFHAMNKGLEMAQGEYVFMLNAGDYFSDAEVLSRTFGSGINQEDILFGDVYRSADGKIFESSIFPDKLTFNFFRKGSLSHQSTFIKRDLHRLIGLYDEQLRFCADWKFFLLAICKYNVSYRHLPFMVAVCDCGGLTCSPANFPAMATECNIVMEQYFPTFLHDYSNIDQMERQQIKNRLKAFQLQVKSQVKAVLGR